MKTRKKYMSYLLLGGILLFGSCTLEEDPPFLTSETIYSNPDNAIGALNGVYHAWADWGTFRYFFPKLLNYNSGFYVSTEGGGPSNNNAVNSSMASLKPLEGDFTLNIVWNGHYNAIARANDVIEGVNSQGSNDETIQDILGQAYFIRAYSYFNLVQLWGDVPLRLVPVDTETLYLGKEDSKVILEQIISDSKSAIQNMNGMMVAGYPRQYAANMLLAKVYMYLATNTELQTNSENYWQLAYNEATEVYGNYSLVADYADLFDGRTNENTQESIFEIQFNSTIKSDLFRDWSIANYGEFPGWMQLRVNPEVYDRHLEAYPTDNQRLESTFLTSYDNTFGGTSTFYPDHNGSDRSQSWNTSFPLPFKTSLKDKTQTNNISQRNTIVYRYADLLLMLAEISNELQNGEQLSYVTEVLDRVGITPSSLYSGGQDAFREAIMAEYNYELLTEGHDWFNNRRRGYQWFKNHVIDPHNNYVNRNENFDVTHDIDESTVMHLPIPAAEVGANPEID